MLIKRWLLLMVLVSGVIHAAEDLPQSTPEAQGIDSSRLNHILQTIQNAKWPVDSVLVMRNGKVVLDSYFYPYSADQLHDLRSVTKSVTGTMLGISIQAGKLAGLKTPVIPFFKDKYKIDRDKNRAAITLGNLIDMRSGIEWSEWPYNANSSIYQMYNSKDWVRFILRQPMDHKPGEAFNYNGATMNLLSLLTGQQWGKPMSEVAGAQLFAPLGISRFSWLADHQGTTLGEAGLALRPQDMARLGQFWLADGVWQGAALLPPGWSANVINEALPTGTGMKYKRGFWIDAKRGTYSAMGRHGQSIVIDPARNMIIVLTGKFPDTDRMPDVVGLIHDAVTADQALPDSVQSQNELKVTVSAVGRAPVVPNSRETGKNWYHKLWRLEGNPLQLSELMLQPDALDAGAITLILKKAGRVKTGPAGMDGAYRFKLDPDMQDMQLAARGQWLDENTLQLEIQYPQYSNSWRFTLKFNGDKLHLQMADNEILDMGVNGKLKVE